MAHSLEKLAAHADNMALSIASSMKEPMTPLGYCQLGCSRHGAYMAKGTRLIRREVWSGCPGCREDEEAAGREERRLAAQRAAAHEHEQRLNTAAVPARFIGRTLDNFKAETPEQTRALSICRDYVANWDNVRRKGSWLVFSGLPGTGKSHLATAILQAIMPRYVGRYMTCMDLIQRLRATWRKDSEMSETELLETLTNIPLLVLDEIGVQYGTESEQNHLFDVLDRRYREVKPTILLTNQNKEGFRQFVGDRVYDRMVEVATWVPFAWPSYRPTARREIPE